MPGFRNRLSSILGRAIALPSPTRGGSRMRESRPYGSVRGARDETRVPTATRPYPFMAAFQTWRDVQPNVNTFTLVIRRSSYACLTNDGAVLKEWRRLQCVNQTLKS